MKILVTGGGGFIGAWIVRALIHAGYEPKIFDKGTNKHLLALIAGDDAAHTLEWISGDVTDTQTMSQAAEGCGAIIHLAGLLTPDCRRNPVLGAQVNLIGTLNAFLAAKTARIKRVLYMSSMGVFGPEGGTIPSPSTLYGAFKLGGEFAARAFYEDNGLESIGFRPFVVYGPGREIGLSAGPSLACRAVALGQAYTIPFSGHVNLIYVEDVATAFVAALTVPLTSAQAVNLWGEHTDEHGMLNALRSLRRSAQITTQGPPMPVVMPPKDDAAEILLPTWKPRSIREGFAETIGFYETHAKV